MSFEQSRSDVFKVLNFEKSPGCLFISNDEKITRAPFGQCILKSRSGVFSISNRKKSLGCLFEIVIRGYFGVHCIMIHVSTLIIQCVLFW